VWAAAKSSPRGAGGVKLLADGVAAALRGHRDGGGCGEAATRGVVGAPGTPPHGGGGGGGGGGAAGGHGREGGGR